MNDVGETHIMRLFKQYRGAPWSRPASQPTSPIDTYCQYSGLQQCDSLRKNYREGFEKGNTEGVNMTEGIGQKRAETDE